jgi:hypothetical protein
MVLFSNPSGLKEGRRCRSTNETRFITVEIAKLS